MPAPNLPPLAELVAQARTLLAARKDEESTASAAADWLAGLGGASKWGPLESELKRVSELADSEVSRQRAASLVRSLGGTVIAYGSNVVSRDAQSGDAGDAGQRASENTYERAVKETAKEAAGNIWALPGAKGLAVGAVSLVAGALVGGPLGLVIGALGIIGGYEVEHNATR